MGLGESVWDLRVDPICQCGGSLRLAPEACRLCLLLLQAQQDSNPAPIQRHAQETQRVPQTHEA